MPIATIYNSRLNPWLKFDITKLKTGWEVIENIHTDEQLVILQDMHKADSELFDHSFVLITKTTIKEFLARKPEPDLVIIKESAVSEFHDISNIKPVKVRPKPQARAPVKKRSRPQKDPIPVVLTTKAKALAKMEKIVKTGTGG